MLAAGAYWIPEAALALLVACCAAAVAASETVATDSPAPQVALRADHMVLDAALQGTRVLVAVQSGRVEVFDWLEGSSLEPLLTLPPEPGHRYPPTISSVAVSPGGRLAAAAIEGEKIALIALRSHRVSALLEGHTAPVQVLAFVQEGRRLISSGNDARVLVWEVPAHPEGGSP